MYKRETDMAEPVGKWLKERGYTVYAEVFSFWRIIDLVGSKNGEIVAVEMKLSLTKNLLRQAYRALLHAHYTYVAVPTRPRETGVEKCRKHGIGVLMVTDNGTEELLPAVKHGLYYLNALII